MSDLGRTRRGAERRSVKRSYKCMHERESNALRVVGQPNSTASAAINRVTERSAAEWAGEGG